MLHLAAGAAALPAASWFASAQVYPSRPITIIVPVPPGGVADPIARILADHLTVTLGQSVVVENVTGAGGSIGVARVARAAPDGYTVSIGDPLVRGTADPDQRGNGRAGNQHFILARTVGPEGHAH